MFRLILLIAAIVVLVLLVKRILAASRDDEGDRQRRIKKGEDMVRCDHCGLHVPQHEAIRAGGKVYCSEEHRRLDQHED